MSRVAGYEGNPEALLKESVSGLMTYLFGSKKNKLLRKEDFLRFQRDLINDLLWLEFCRYLRKDQSIFDKISEEDFSCPDSYKHSESSKPTHLGTAPTTSNSSASPSIAIGSSNCPSCSKTSVTRQHSHSATSGDPEIPRPLH